MYIIHIYISTYVFGVCVSTRSMATSFSDHEALTYTCLVSELKGRFEICVSGLGSLQHADLKKGLRPLDQMLIF